MSGSRGSLSRATSTLLYEPQISQFIDLKPVNINLTPLNRGYQRLNVPARHLKDERITWVTFQGDQYAIAGPYKLSIMCTLPYSSNMRRALWRS